MKQLFLLSFLLLSQLSKSQSFIEDYYEAQRLSWEITEEKRSQVNPKIDSMHRADWGVGWLEHKMETKKWNIDGKVEMMKKIISNTPYVQTNKPLYFVEETQLKPDIIFLRNGFIKDTGSTAYYSYDLVNRDTIYIHSDFPTTSNSEQQKSREIILNLVKNSNLKRLLELNELEDSVKSEQRPTLQYEIIYYNPELDKNIQTIVLHEWIVDLD